MRSFVFALLLAAGCSQPDNTQFVPIGQFCAEDNDCGTRPYTCRHDPGGYCTKACAANGECPMDSECTEGVCRRKCSAPDQCRGGYDCRVNATTSPVCIP